MEVDVTVVIVSAPAWASIRTPCRVDFRDNSRVFTILHTRSSRTAD